VKEKIASGAVIALTILCLLVIVVLGFTGGPQVRTW
jgi:hypothetical protein